MQEDINDRQEIEDSINSLLRSIENDRAKVKNTSIDYKTDVTPDIVQGEMDNLFYEIVHFKDSILSSDDVNTQNANKLIDSFKIELKRIRGLFYDKDSQIANKVFDKDDLQNRISDFKKGGSKNLNLKNLGLLRIPQEVFELNPVILDLSANNIREIPDEIELLKNLEILNLANNKIKVLPDSLFRLKLLKEVYLSQNSIFHLPTELNDWSPVVILDLSFNRIYNLPDCFGGFFQLKSLFLQNNRISEIPSSISRLKLDVLNISSNSIDSFPSALLNITGLKSLYLTDNEVRSVPIEITNLRKLQRLELPNNFLLDPFFKRKYTIMELYDYIQKKEEMKFEKFKIKLPQEWRTPLKQYLMFFKEFVKISKNKDLNFIVLDTEEGIEIKTKATDQNEIQEFSDYLVEYINFVKNKNTNTIKIESNLSDHQVEILKLKLENQVSQLNNSIRILEMENRLLKTQNDFFQQLSLTFASKEAKISIQSIHDGNQQFGDQIVN